MEKTKFPTAGQLTQSVVELEVRLRDMMTVFAAIAMLQDDKMFSVPLSTIEQLPPGSSVDFSFNRVTKEYEFRYVEPLGVAVKDEPAVAESASLTSDDKVTGGLR